MDWQRVAQEREAREEREAIEPPAVTGRGQGSPYRW
jgi:hypothetical protein